MRCIQLAPLENCLGRPFLHHGRPLFGRVLATNLSTVCARPALSLRRCEPPTTEAVLALRHRSFHHQPPLRKRVPFLLADIGEGITECEIVKWFVKPGDQVEQFAKICEVQSDKAAVEITSRYDGVIAALHYKAGDVAKVGSPLVDIDAEAGEDSNDKSDDVSESQPDRMAPAPAEAISQDSAGTRDASASSSEDAASRNGWTLATPAVRRVARENGVNLNLVKGSGPGGRILKGDVLAYSAGLGKRAPETGPLKPDITADARTPPISHSTSISAGTTVQPLTAVQKAMFKTMTRTLSIPHFCYSDTISLDAVAVVRRSINDHLTKNAPKGKGAVDKYGGVTKISYMPIFIKALSIALKDYPILNACIVDGEDAATAKLKYREEHNIGVAMDTAQGLLVPNIKNVESKSIIEIASELSRLRTLSQSNALTPNDLSNGTITLSNIGIVGGTVLHPCLVPTELCIGAIGAAKRTPVFKVGEDGVERVVASSLMGVSFAADHRVIDGATLARFVACWKDLLEDPAWMGALLR